MPEEQSDGLRLCTDTNSSGVISDDSEAVQVQYGKDTAGGPNNSGHGNHDGSKPRTEASKPDARPKRGMRRGAQEEEAS